MAQQHISLGTPPNGADGDTNRTAWTKTEANFNELYGEVTSLHGELDGLPPVIGKNLLINPQGRIRQRNFAGGALAAGVYGYDRWKAGAGGCNVTVNATTGVFTHTSGPLVQVIEAPRIAGQVVTFSVADPSGSVGVNIDGVTASITAGSGRRAVSLTVPSGSTGNVTLTITATGVTYKDPQLELGEVLAPIFEVRPLALEVLMCQRYYEKSYGIDVAPGTNTNNGRIATAFNVSSAVNIFGTRFQVRKRATPSVTIYSATGTAGSVNQDDSSMVAASIPFAGDSGFEITWTNGAGRWGAWYHYVADAEI